jgi:hypothetical protein
MRDREDLQRGRRRSHRLDDIRKKLPDVLFQPDLEMVVLHYFRHLGHDNHRRLCKVYWWEEKKSKASWGAQIVEYEKIAAAAAHAMTTADTIVFSSSARLCPTYIAPATTRGKRSRKTRTSHTARRGTRSIRQR